MTLGRMSSPQGARSGNYVGHGVKNRTLEVHGNSHPALSGVTTKKKIGNCSDKQMAVFFNLFLFQGLAPTDPHPFQGGAATWDPGKRNGPGADAIGSWATPWAPIPYGMAMGGWRAGARSPRGRHTKQRAYPQKKSRDRSRLFLLGHPISVSVPP